MIQSSVYGTIRLLEITNNTFFLISGDVLIILYSFSPYANYYKLKGSDGVEGYAETRHLEEVNPS